MMPGLCIDLFGVTPWGSNWMWSMPLIVITVVFHAYALGLINRGVSFVLRNTRGVRLRNMPSLIAIGGSALCATILFCCDATIWAIAYRLFNAVRDWKSAMLYSLMAMTTYGEIDIRLEPRWQLMGSLEALNGLILFGLTTAFLFAIFQRVWSDSNPPI